MVLPTIIVATLVRMVASDKPLVIVVPLPADHIVVAVCLTSITEAVVHRGDPVGHWCPSGLGMNRGLPILPRRCHGNV